MIESTVTAAASQNTYGIDHHTVLQEDWDNVGLKPYVYLIIEDREVTPLIM